jgi:hypothetical protein
LFLWPAETDAFKGPDRVYAVVKNQEYDRVFDRKIEQVEA